MVRLRVANRARPTVVELTVAKGRMSLSPPNEEPQNGSDQHDADAGSEAQERQRRSNAPNVRKEDGQECEPNPD